MSVCISGFHSSVCLSEFCCISQIKQQPQVQQNVECSIFPLEGDVRSPKGKGEDKERMSSVLDESLPGAQSKKQHYESIENPKLVMCRKDGKEMPPCSLSKPNRMCKQPIGA